MLDRPGAPELDDQRHDAKARPVERAGNGADVELCRVERLRLFECVAALQRRGLLAGPGADLGQPRPGPEIRVGLRVPDFFVSPAQAHLAPEPLPRKNQRRLWLPRDFPPFLAVSIPFANHPPPAQT